MDPMPVEDRGQRRIFLAGGNSAQTPIYARRPLYFAEAVAVLGILLQYRTVGVARLIRGVC